MSSNTPRGLLRWMRSGLGKVGARTALRLHSTLDRYARRFADEEKRSKGTFDALAVLTQECEVSNLAGRPSAIRVGPRSLVRGELLVYPSGGRIEIGADCYVGAGTRIWSASSVWIGDRVLISHGCDIHDGDAHSLEPDLRARHFARIRTIGHGADPHGMSVADVFIEDDAWIGFGASILKGVRIGRAAVVGARSVVTRDVAPRTVVVGNPARVVRVV